jgi:hypothetical protein
MQKKYIQVLKSNKDFQVDIYQLVNNHGYYINYKGHRFDLRHWLNVYGQETDFWNMWSNTTSTFKTKDVNENITHEDLINLMEEIIKGV